MGQARKRGTRDERIAEAQKRIEEERKKNPPKAPKTLSLEAAMVFGLAEAFNAPVEFEYLPRPISYYPTTERHKSKRRISR